MTDLEKAVYALVEHNLSEPDPALDYPAWVVWNEQTERLIKDVTAAESEQYPGKVGADF